MIGSVDGAAVVVDQANSDIRSMARRARDNMRQLLAYFHKQDCGIKVSVHLCLVASERSQRCWCFWVGNSMMMMASFIHQAKNDDPTIRK